MDRSNIVIGSGHTAINLTYAEARQVAHAILNRMWEHYLHQDGNATEISTIERVLRMLDYPIP